MAGEFQFTGTSGLTHKVVLRNVAGLVWRVDTAAFGTWSDAQVANYGITATEQGTSGWFAGTMPAGVNTAGLLLYAAYQIAGASLALTDQPAVALGGLEWDGSAQILPVSSLTVLGLAGSIHWTYTVYDVDTVTPLPGVSIYVSSDVGGLLRSPTQVSDAVGQVSFALNAGTYYIWRSHPTREFVDPDTEVVST